MPCQDRLTYNLVTALKAWRQREYKRAGNLSAISFQRSALLIMTIEAVAKFILGWWHRLSSLCKGVLEAGAALMTLSFLRWIYQEYQGDILGFDFSSAQAGKPAPPDSLG